ncbi:cation-translocating P-type ATPase [Desulfuromonas thiophila]|uniref:Sodium/potassium-transporting ATPase subunit alpha n=1 Tax=Desulfuromonas thiophila TaxID=57664 RepID=A0A1G6WYT0_9BACT|nr:cation-transporting P-type ATPase [Desulfuromonas thiophila]SDD70969.1 sodium/potassium-transporting ATPase subunit alpha [Desulfuromonas thiophila]
MNRRVQIQHLVTDQVFSSLGSRPTGLTAAEALERLREVGRNTVEVRDRWRLGRSLLRQFTNFFTLLLLAAALLCGIAEYLQPGQGMRLLGQALAGVALLNALFSFGQEYRAEKAMQALREFLPAKVEVRRDNRIHSLLAEQLVPGDLLLLQEGDRVPADVRLVRVEGLVVNNAPLTGEANPLALTAAPVDSPLNESRNLAFAGCLVLRGNGEAVVFATGSRTEFGKLAYLSQAVRREIAPLERQTAHMVRILTRIALGLGLTFFLYGIFSGLPLWGNLIFAVGIIVANVPEGLLPTFTLALAMGSLRMARKNVLVTSLNAVEALGATQVICTDKTGTLTQNRLAIARLCGPLATTALADHDQRARLLHWALCASDIQQVDQHDRGDPVDIAIAQQARAENLSLASDWSDRKFFPFDVEKKRSAGCDRIAGQATFAVKGAWESIRPLLRHLDQGSPDDPPVTEEQLRQADAVMRQLADSGYRVLAVAGRSLPAAPTAETTQDTLEQDLCLGGFLALEDPLRPEVPAALNRCREAGIRVILITGDHPATALAIARSCGIVPPDTSDEEILTGQQLEQLSTTELEDVLQRGVRIFARTSPGQKMKIVLALKNQDQVVAMTGDGVNDAPALKAADIGIAMGLSGTDVARASAQIILLDDNFASIVAGIEEGRTVFHNMRKFTNYVLVSNGPEILPYLLYILLPVPLALSVIQILVIDLGTDILPSMALGQEPPDPEIMQQPPRGRDFQLLSPALVVHSYLFLGLLEAVWSLGLFFYVLHTGGWQFGQELAATDPLYRSATGITLATILLMQIGNLVGRRFDRRSGLDRGLVRNRLMLLGILVQILFSWALLYVPALQRLLGTGPVAWPIYLLAWLGIPLIFGADGLRKWLSSARA